MFLAMVTPFLLFNILCTSSFPRTRAFRVPLSALYRLETSATPIVACAEASEGPPTKVEAPKSPAGACSVTSDKETVAGDVTIVAGVEGAVVVSTPLVALLIPARPASLMPAVGAGLGNPAEGVTSMGPPNGPFTGVDWLAVWPRPKTAERTVNPAIS